MLLINLRVYLTIFFVECAVQESIKNYEILESEKSSENNISDNGHSGNFDLLVENGKNSKFTMYYKTLDEQGVGKSRS